MNAIWKTGPIIGCLTLALAVSDANGAGDAANGQDLYLHMCSGCHAVEYNNVGPMHAGVFGRKAGSVAGFEYSPALKKAQWVWDEAHLDKWLTNPESLAPGQKMNFSVPAAEDRADLIAYLKTLKP